VLRGEIETITGGWLEAPFLLDVGADRTVLSATIASALGVTAAEPTQQLRGIGGVSPFILVNTALRFTNQTGTKVQFRSQFAAFTALDALDMSVLGRDITNLFAVIVDRPQDVVCLLGQRHRYEILET
jgi:hypothetical protein